MLKATDARCVTLGDSWVTGELLGKDIKMDVMGEMKRDLEGFPDRNRVAKGNRAFRHIGQENSISAGQWWHRPLIRRQR